MKFIHANGHLIKIKNRIFYKLVSIGICRININLIYIRKYKEKERK